MATSTFERKIEISDTASLKKLVDVMTADAPKKPLSTPERDRSEYLLKRFLSR